MNQEKLNKIRRVAGIAPSYNRIERQRLDKTQESRKVQYNLEEAANHRAPPKILADIAKQYLHVRSLEKTGDDNKDYHDCPCWAIENALKAAYKAGQLAAKKNVNESVVEVVEKESKDKESAKESKKSGSNPVFDPKGGEKVPKKGKDAVEKKNIKEKVSDHHKNYTSPYKKGDYVKYNNATHIVQVPDARADYIGIIRTSLYNASEDRKNKSVDLVHIRSVRPASGEDCEMAYAEEGNADVYGTNNKAGTMEGSSEEYKNPKGTKLTADPKSGANAKTLNSYKSVPHKDDSKKAKSEDKGTKNLKKIGESDVETVWNRDYGRDDGRVDKNENPDQIAVADPNTKMKVSVPNKYKTALRREIGHLRKESDKVRFRDPFGSEFYENTANAFENILGHLEEGTRRSLLLAQIDMNRIMTPMQQRIPNEVYLYIIRGGKPSSLNELFKEVKVKRKGANLSKEELTQ
jgi:hypothetical protein